MEIWKWIPGFEGRYDVSTTGTFRSYVPDGHCRIIQPFKRKNGYPALKLGRKQFSCHRLMALTFIANPDRLKEINHRDGDKANFALDNLEWSTRKLNLQHASRMGLLRPNPARGEAAKKSHLTNEDVLAIRREYATGETTQRKLAERYGVDRYAIYAIVNRRTWTHI